MINCKIATHTQIHKCTMPNVQRSMPFVFTVIIIKQWIWLNSSKYTNEKTYKAVWMPVSWQIKNTNKMMIVDMEINEMKIERFKIV